MLARPSVLASLVAVVASSLPLAQGIGSDELGTSASGSGPAVGGLVVGSRDEHAGHAGGEMHHHGPHPPIGVMGGHTHDPGEWMLSLRWMRMHMDGNRSGRERLSSSEVLAQGFAVTPTQMDVDMLMLGAMVGVTDRLTLAGMVPWLWKSMDHVTVSGGGFTTESSGLGDLMLAGLVRLSRIDEHRTHLNLGISLPTGSIHERDSTPAGRSRLPYPMQLGTGTVDLLPGLTYTGRSDEWSWGAQGTARFHLGENVEHYRLGNRLESTGWLARGLGPGEASFRLRSLHWGNIHGADPTLDPTVVPTAAPDLRGGDRVDALLGFSLHAAEGLLAGQELALEVGLPLYQDLDGPQLETDWTLTVAWRLWR